MGIKVSLCTGRAARSILPITSQLALDGYHISFDGALVSEPNHGQELYIKLLSKKVVKEAVEFAHLHDILIEFYSTTHYFAEEESWFTEIRRKFFEIESTLRDFTNLWKEERIIKGTLTVLSPEERANSLKFINHFQGRLDFSYTKSPAFPDVDFINVLAPGVSKRKALETLARHLGIAMNQIMGIGDGVNDISLLSVAGLAIAMGNATDEVKAVADYITLDVDHNGVAEAIKRFLL